MTDMVWPTYSLDFDSLASRQMAKAQTLCPQTLKPDEIQNLTASMVNITVWIIIKMERISKINCSIFLYEPACHMLFSMSFLWINHRCFLWSFFFLSNEISLGKDLFLESKNYVSDFKKTTICCYYVKIINQSKNDK